MSSILGGNDSVSLDQDNIFITNDSILLGDAGAAEQRKDVLKKVGLAVSLTIPALIYFLVEGGRLGSDSDREAIPYLIMATIVSLGAIVLAFQAAFGLRETSIAFDGMKGIVVRSVRKGFKKTEEILEGNRIESLEFHQVPVPLGPGVKAFDVRMNITDGQPWFLRRVFNTEHAEELMRLVQEWRETFIKSPIDN